jgi:membrane protein
VFDTRIWAVPLEELGTWRRVLYRAGRILYSTASEYREKKISFRAAGLTYFSVLSIVPFLAFAFSVVKGLGGYRRLIDGTLVPYAHRTFGENPTLLRAVDQLIAFVSKTDVARLGTFGVLFLAYSAISLLSTIEQVLNEIWGAKAKRSILRQVTDYTTLMVIAPLLILVAATLATTAQSSDLVRFLRDSLSLGAVIDSALKLSSLVLSWIAMLALFLIMPKARVKVSSALLGSLTAALLWQGALLLQVKLQAGVARYNVLYAGFAAIPIFLVWLYASWLAMLVGALVGASHQNEKSARQRFRAEKVDQDLREELTVAIAGRVAGSVLDGHSPVTAASLADDLGAPLPTVAEALAALTRAGIAVPTCAADDPSYVPAVDLDEATVDRVRAAVRRDPAAEDMRQALRRSFGTELAGLLRRLDGEIEACGHDVNLRELGKMSRGRS